MPSSKREPDFWVAIEPENFEYGRTYQLRYNEYSGGTPVYELPNTSFSAFHEILARSNFTTIERDTELQDKVAYGRSGTFQTVIYRADEDPSRAVEELIGALESYPVLDDMLHSEMENEIVARAWDNWGRDEFVDKTLAVIVQKAIATDLGMELEEDDIVDVLKDNPSVVDEVWGNIRGWEYQEVSEHGTVFHFTVIQHYLADELTNEMLYKKLQPALDLFVAEPEGTLKPL